MPIRPKSIIQFEQVYWAIIVLGLVSAALGWSDMMASVQVQQSVAHFGMGMVYGPIVLGILVQLLLWYFIARRGSVVAKWIFVVLSGLGVVFSLFSLVTKGSPSIPVGVIDVALLVLQVIAIMLVFRPDTRPWFGENAGAA